MLEPCWSASYRARAAGVAPWPAMLRSISLHCAIICRMSAGNVRPARVVCRISAQCAIMALWSMPAWFMPDMLEWSMPCILE